MNRRPIGLLVILVLGLLVAPLAAAVPPPGKMPRIGVLELGLPTESPDWKARSPFWQELRMLGWLERQNIVLEYRGAEEQPNRLSALAAELVQLPVDVIVVNATPVICAVNQATTTIPIVMISVGDPVEMGFVADLAQPGGNITGVGGVVPELRTKLLELLKEAVPGVTQMAILTDLDRRLMDDTQRAAQAVGVHMHFLVVGYPDQFEPAFKEAIREGAGALVVIPSPLFAYHLRELAALAPQHGLPAIFWLRRFAEVGSLMAYGPSPLDLLRRAAT